MLEVAGELCSSNTLTHAGPAAGEPLLNLAEPASATFALGQLGHLLLDELGGVTDLLRSEVAETDVSTGSEKGGVGHPADVGVALGSFEVGSVLLSVLRSDVSDLVPLGETALVEILFSIERILAELVSAGHQRSDRNLFRLNSPAG
jgi:hypothetical protein